MVGRGFMIIIACTIIQFEAVAQPERPDTLWTKRYGGPNTEECSAMCRTQDGGYLLAGLVYDPTVTTQFFRTDSLGNLIWSRRYGGDSSYTMASDVTPTQDGGYLVVGYIAPMGPPWYSDIYLIRLNDNGDTLWTKTWGTQDRDRANTVISLSDGSFIVAGYTEYTDNPMDMYVLKLDENGDTLWTRIYVTPETDACRVTKVMPNGDLLLAGWGDIMRINAMGDTLWTKKFTGLSIYSMYIGPDNEIIVSGRASVGAPWYDNLFLARLSESGDTVWTRVYRGEYDASAVSIAPAPGGGYVMTGEGEPECEGEEYFTDVYIWRTDESGNLLWNGCYNLTENDESMAILPTSDGGYAIAGQTHTPGRAFDMFLIKTRPDPLDVPSDHIPTIPTRLELSAYPNPFNSTTKIEFTLPVTQRVSLQIYDVLGREVAVLLNEMKTAGEHRVRFDGEALSSGVYFCRMEAGTATRTQKIVLMK